MVLCVLFASGIIYTKTEKREQKDKKTSINKETNGRMRGED